MSEYIIVLSTTNSIDSAKQIARMLVSENLAACVNIVDKIESIYRWQGKVVEDNEVLMLIKTQKSMFEQLKSKIEQVHPYSTPEIVSIDVAQGTKSYLDWIKSSTSV